MPDPVMYKIDGKEYKISVRAKDEYDLEMGWKISVLQLHCRWFY